MHVSKDSIVMAQKILGGKLNSPVFTHFCRFYTG